MSDALPRGVISTSARAPRGAPDDTRLVIANASADDPFGVAASHAEESSGEAI